MPTRLRSGLPDWTVSSLSPYAFGCLVSCVLNLVVAVLCDSIGIRYIIAVLRDTLCGWAFCPNCNKEEYYYYYYLGLATLPVNVC